MKDCGKILFSEIKGFKDFYYKKGYDKYDDDGPIPYLVINVLHLFIEEKYLDVDNYILKGDKEKFNKILELLNKIYLYGDKDISELIIVGFIEGYITESEEEFIKFIKILKYDSLINGAKELKKDFYKL